MQRPSATLLPDGKRLHLQHGPIDLVIGASGNAPSVKAAYATAQLRFETVLEELVSELALLRHEVPKHGLGLRGNIAKTMEKAVQPYWNSRVTPMAAVAGAVAEEILHAMTSTAELSRAYVNNGGDIAIHLTGNELFVAASPAGKITIHAFENVRGIATSGWRGRSFSLGIADAVTVLGRSAAEADVAATLIANAIDLPNSNKITRQRACELSPDSDLGTRPVTTGVDPLSLNEIEAALRRGAGLAQELIDHHAIEAASLLLGGQIVTLKYQQQLERAYA